MMPVVDEGDERPNPQVGSQKETDFAKQLTGDLVLLDETLQKIERQVRPDEERKVQLEKDAGAVSQFVMQVKTLADDIKASKELDTPIKIDGGDLIQGVQGLIDVIREIKEQREATDPKELRQPRESRKQQRKQRQADHKI